MQAPVGWAFSCVEWALLAVDRAFFSAQRALLAVDCARHSTARKNPVACG